MTQTLDSFTRAYIEAALWSSTAYNSPAHQEADANGDGDRYDTSFERENYSEEDLSPELRAHIIADCADFQDANRADLDSAPDWYTAESAGHDFWLTRNGHGAGFWDQGLDRLGTKLSEAAKVYGGEDWYVDTTDPDNHVIRSN